jgi:hypothetical protein
MVDLRTLNDAVVVAGAGAAGMAAAIAAARQGAWVLLLEQAARLGGTVTGSLLHTLAGFHDLEGQLMNAGLPAELIDRLGSQSEASLRRIGRTWTVVVSPEAYADVTQRWLAVEPGITVATEARVCHVEVSGRRVVALSVDSPQGRFAGAPRGVVDATGSAEIVRMIDPGLVADDSVPGAGGLITRLRSIEIGSDHSLAGVRLKRIVSRAVAEGRLPPQCEHVWFDHGIRNDEIYIKQLVAIPPRRPDQTSDRSFEPPEEAVDEQRRLLEVLATIDGFRNARVDAIGALGARDAGRVIGEYVLTADDLRSARKFNDAACRGSWPIEHWDARGGVSLEYLVGTDHYEIPLRSLKVRGMTNVWTAGKCLSADRLAQASARVVGLCWAMGEAVGKAAACHESA